MKHPTTRNSPCWCGSGKKYKKCHWLKDKAKAVADRWESSDSSLLIKTEEQVDGIRKSGQLTKDILDMLEGRIVPGLTPNEINEWCHRMTLEHGAIPAPLNYRGFPKSVCTSVNNVICHGIPNDTPLKDGDTINVDVTCKLNGYFGDASRMYFVGTPSEESKRLVQVTKECLTLGIMQVRPFNTLGDIGYAVQTHAEKHGYSVVRSFAGHGTGLEFHEDPQVLHYGSPKKGLVLKPNMVFTIEPMINIGKADSKVLSDGWTAVTVDGSLSAQWEHTMRVTPEGVEVLTE